MRHMLKLAGAFALAALPLKAQEMVTDFMLDNGMQVVVVEDHRAPVAMHMVWYKAGSADEDPGVSGIAHFLEHLMFKGTDNLDVGEFSRVVAENGGRDNAFTSYDYTAYYQRVAADRLELMMQMESDRMVNLRLTEDDILTERDVIIEERNQRTENNAGALFREQRQAAQYMNHRYGVPIIGWRHEMEKLDMQDALDFYEKFYAPNNAILIVAGDVDPEEVKALAETYYGVIPANPELTERDRPQEPPQTSARRMEFFDPRAVLNVATDHAEYAVWMKEVLLSRADLEVERVVESATGIEGRNPTKYEQKAIDEVMADMEGERPMDRLVCGDVGYGKTEVALRAVMKAALGGKQAAFLAPTTVLVEAGVPNAQQEKPITMDFTTSRITVVSRMMPPASSTSWGSTCIPSVVKNTARNRSRIGTTWFASSCRKRVPESTKPARKAPISRLKPRASVAHATPSA